MITRVNFNNERFANYLDYVPYNVTLNELYKAETLYAGYDPEHPESFDTCYDQQVYKYFLETGKIPPTPLESFSRAMHDHFIREGIRDIVNCYEKTKVVAVMGGSAMRRDDDSYRSIAIISKRLTEGGSLMVSGGGSGAMEATMLGSYMAGRTLEELDDAISILKKSPKYGDDGYMEVSYIVMKKYPHIVDYESLSIPTWLYGHEPTSPFATYIGKFFENSIREDILLSISFGGIIYTPGSAGTMQEVFQDAVQNHYLTLGMASPMVFFNKDFWTTQMPIYPMLQTLSEKGKYSNLLLSLTDSTAEVINIIEDFQRQQHQQCGCAPA